MTTADAQIDQATVFMREVLLVRKIATVIAYQNNDDVLFQAVVDEDDQQLHVLLSKELEQAQDEFEGLRVKFLPADASMVSVLRHVEHVQEVNEKFGALTELVEMLDRTLKVRADKGSGYEPAKMSTATLMRTLRAIDASEAASAKN